MVPQIPDAVLESEYFRTKSPIELLIENGNLRRHSPSAHYFVRANEFPQGSFLKISDGIYVVSPHLLFLELATRIDLIELIYLGSQLASKYVITDDEQGFVKSTSLFSVESLLLYLEKMDGYPGIKKARCASKYIVGKGESPMETCSVLLLTLPRRLGGFGIPKPVLGYEIDLDPVKYMEYPKSSLRFDMLWKEARLDVEYDSMQFHSSQKKLIEDSMRRNIIRSLKYDIITITYKEYVSIDLMTNIAKIISKHIGYKLQGLDIIWRSRSETLRDILKNCI